jgi:cell division protein FtsW (lipid II flippase)
MDLIKYFTNLYKEGRQIALLTWIYGTVAAIAVVIAGLFAIVNQDLGRAILIIPVVCVLVLLLNLVAWSIIHTIFDTLKNKQKTAKKSEK